MDEIIKKLPTDVKRGPIEYWGWINGKKEDESKLYELGVNPGLIFKDEGGDTYFNNCVCDKKTLLKLIKKWPGIFPGAFTAVDTITDKQLPPKEQEFWKY